MVGWQVEMVGWQVNGVLYGTSRRVSDGRPTHATLRRRVIESQRVIESRRVVKSRRVIESQRASHSW